MANTKPKVKKFEVRFKIDPRRIFSLILIIFFGLYFLSLLAPASPNGEEIPLSQALKDIKEKKVEEIVVEAERIILHYPENKVLVAIKEDNQSMAELLQQVGIDPTTVNLRAKNLSPGRLVSLFLEVGMPILFTVGILYFLSRQAGRAQDVLFSFGKSNARRFAKGKQKITFKDVGGVDEAKAELEEIVDFLENPQRYRRLGARTPKGVLLVGPSGTGKTLLAKAVAGEANVPFFTMAGSEFMEMLVGVGASRTRDLFAQAKRAAPSIIFIDELDAIGSARGMGLIGGHREQEQTLNQILVEMDGFTPNDKVIVMAASVVGETPILIKEESQAKLVSVAEFIDKFFANEKEEGEKQVNNVYCLGFERKVSSGRMTKRNLYFKQAAFKKLRSVFRHAVKEIYEIEYLGGKLRTTGNHSVFVRSPQGLKTKAVANLRKGDILIDLPFKVNRTNKDLMEVRAAQFKPDWSMKLPFFEPEIEKEWQAKHLFALNNKDSLSQSQIAQETGVCQTVISQWQRGISNPRQISRAYFKHKFPEEARVTPELCRLLGYYVAEGYARKEVDFCFSIQESKKIEDLISLTKNIFNIEPDSIKHITSGAVNIVYHASPLAKFLVRHCGKGAQNKHVPGFLFEAPYEYFIEFLRGVFNGDGYEDKRGKGEITSVSRKLVYELNWLCRMHGMKTYIGGFTAKEGRKIKGGKPLKATQAYRLGWGKANNPFSKHRLEKAYPVKRAIVRKVTKLPFNGFVYDLCGVDNEAFFGGENPVLLHNTNRPDTLDSALVRPGRFDRRVMLDMPDIKERTAVLKIHARGKPLAKTVNWEKVAKRTVGFSGADLESMLNEAAILAARNKQQVVKENDIEEAATKVKLGPARKRLQSTLEKKMTAYHEAGHAVAAHYLPTMDRVHRVSIVSRGLALGFTLIPPERDKYTETRTEILEKVSALLGGRAAEELVFKELTGGAASDIDQATRMVRRMVMEYGMSDLGPIYLGPQVDNLEWGRVMVQPTEISEAMQAKVDEIVKKIVNEAYQKAKEILRQHQKKLNLIGEKLVEQETIEGDEFSQVMGARK